MTTAFRIIRVVVENHSSRVVEYEMAGMVLSVTLLALQTREDPTKEWVIAPAQLDNAYGHFLLLIDAMDQEMTQLKKSLTNRSLN